jgi:hypothetical protein
LRPARSEIGSAAVSHSNKSACTIRPVSIFHSWPLCAVFVLYYCTCTTQNTTPFGLFHFQETAHLHLHLHTRAPSSSSCCCKVQTFNGTSLWEQCLKTR